MVLDEELYHVTIASECTDLVVTENMPGKVMLFLAAKKLDGMSIHTIKNYSFILRRFCNVLHKDIEQITSMDIRMFLALRSKEGLKNSSMAATIAALKSFFSWLENEEYITKSPMRKIKNIKVEKRLRKALTREELEMLRDVAKDLRDKAMLELFYSTGCRLDEIQKLNISDIDWANNQVRVIGKGNKERIVFLNARARIHLKKYLKTRKDTQPYLFVSERAPHNQLGRRAIEKTFEKLGIKAGINRDVYPHLIRHTTATHMLQGGATLEEVQAYLGHDSPATTQIYAQIDNNAVKQSHLKHVV
ncbi:MAG: tyrosine-type recombinase/integrase [Clostridiaceae bacterium]|nr:tyrosine-type recombinase/integrase [Clostridiaceae bacterium]